MSKIIAIAKVMHHIEEMKKVVDQLGVNVPVLYEPDSEHCYQTAAREISNGTKVIVCSDFLKLHFFESFNVKIVPVARSPYYFAKRLKEVCDRDPETMALCRSDANSYTDAMRAAAELLGDRVTLLYANNTDEVDAVMRTLSDKRRGTPIVSPVWAHEVISRYGFEPVTIPYDGSDFANALNQAVGELALMEEREKFSEIVSTVLDLVTVGIVCMDVGGMITGVNQAAVDGFGLSHDCVGRLFSEVGLSALAPLVTGSVTADERDALINVGDIPAKVNVIPQLVDGKVNAYVATLSPTEDILADERRIRRSLISGENIAKLDYDDIVGSSPAIAKTRLLARRFASVDSTILINGPSGCGKEVFAQSIHNMSDRRDQPFVVINCAALPETLLESILFGYEKGSFTGAQREGKRGLFETAHKGTVFLDEISEMPLSMQARFLRVIQEREVMRVGSTKPVPIDIRIIAATNRDLRTMVDEKLFREDLYYRISVLVLDIPPLSQRREDIPQLAERFVRQRSRELGRPELVVTRDALALLSELELKGNVRELNNILERCTVMAEDGIIDRDTIAAFTDTRNRALPKAETLPERVLTAEAGTIRELLLRTNGSRKDTAAALGISTSTLWRKMKALGIE